MTTKLADSHSGISLNERESVASANAADPLSVASYGAGANKNIRGGALNPATVARQSRDAKYGQNSRHSVRSSQIKPPLVRDDL